MKVMYDHQIFSTQVYGGISRYFIELMKKFEKDDEIKYDLPLKISNNYYLKQLSNVSYTSFFSNYKFKEKDRIINYFNKMISKNIISKQNFDIFHPTYYDPYFLEYIGHKPFVLTVHDMIHEIFPEIFPETFSLKDKTAERKKLLIQKAAKIITVSKNTKKDIIKILGVDENKIEVIYHGNPFRIRKNDESINIKIPEKYILFVGNRMGYKNFELFIDAISILIQDEDNLNVVCAGGGNFRDYEISKFKKLNISEKLFYYSGSDAVLSYLYGNAIAFVFPSLYEGFGIPILESFACKCPVIISNASSFPEVAGNAAIYFNPQDKFSILNSIRKVVYDKGLRKILITKGFQRVKKFTWRETAQRTKRIYESIV